MLHGLGLHAEQLQVWALRATEGNLYEDSSKAIGDEVSLLWVMPHQNGVAGSCWLTWMLVGTTQCALAGSWGSSLSMTLLAIASQRQGSI